MLQVIDYSYFECDQKEKCKYYYLCAIFSVRQNNNKKLFLRYWLIITLFVMRGKKPRRLMNVQSDLGDLYAKTEMNDIDGGEKKIVLMIKGC